MEPEELEQRNDLEFKARLVGLNAEELTELASFLLLNT